MNIIVNVGAISLNALLQRIPGLTGKHISYELTKNKFSYCDALENSSRKDLISR